MATVTEGGAAHTITCARVLQWEEAGAGEQEVTTSKWSSRRPFEENCGQHLAWSSSYAECGNLSPVNKLGPDRSWQVQKVKSTVEQTAGGNTRRPTRKSSSLSDSNDLRFEGADSSILRGEVRRSGELCGRIHGQRHAQHVGKCEGERMPVGKSKRTKV